MGDDSFFERLDSGKFRVYDTCGEELATNIYTSSSGALDWYNVSTTTVQAPLIDDWGGISDDVLLSNMRVRELKNIIREVMNEELYNHKEENCECDETTLWIPKYKIRHK